MHRTEEQGIYKEATKRGNRYVSAPIRFFNRVSITPGCWIWTGPLGWGGYGRFTIGRRSVIVHRFSYEYFNGPIPKGLCIDHLCRNRACVRPDHLEAVTQKENIRRGNTGKDQSSRRKTRNPDEAWCYRCECFLYKKEFNKDSNRWSGVDNKCRSCNAKHRKIKRNEINTTQSQ